MKVKNRLTETLGIKYPIIQAGMVWVSGWKLASAVSNSGGLGLLGAGSMKPELLDEHIKKCKAATEKPFGVNLPMLRKDVDDLIKVILDNNIQTVFTSAGHPGRYIEKFKDQGCFVAHVVSNVKQALKSQEVGCDAVVGEGVEAGGHNGSDEITTMVLIPQLVNKLSIPVIAAGGIASGNGILAAMALGAEGVQIGTRFAATIESSAHAAYKNRIVESGDTDTTLILKKIGMARIIKNSFGDRVLAAEKAGADEARLKTLLDMKREMKGIFEGDFEEGMMEVGQCVGLIESIVSVHDLFQSFISEYDHAINEICKG